MQGKRQKNFKQKQKKERYFKTRQGKVHKTRQHFRQDETK